MRIPLRVNKAGRKLIIALTGAVPSTRMANLPSEPGIFWLKSVCPATVKPKLAHCIRRIRGLAWTWSVPVLASVARVSFMTLVGSFRKPVDILLVSAVMKLMLMIWE